MHTALRTLRCPVLVGRDDVLELADRRLEEAIAGRGHCLLLDGDAEIGKTRLPTAITRREDERVLATGRCYIPEWSGREESSRTSRPECPISALVRGHRRGALVLQDRRMRPRTRCQSRPSR